METDYITRDVRITTDNKKQAQKIVLDLLDIGIDFTLKHSIFDGEWYIWILKEDYEELLLLGKYR